jgi:NitT/TauT family transport system permease protein
MRADRTLRETAMPLCFVAGGLALLELAMRLSLVSPLTVASPSQIIESLPLLVEEGIGARILQTFAETLSATLIAIAIGGPIGWTLARRPTIDRAFRGWVAVVASAPLILLYPLFLVAFGRNSGTIIAIGTMSALAPITLKTRDGVSEVRTVLTDVGRSFGMSEAGMLRSIVLPAATPSIVTGVRLAIIFALANVVAIEFIINYGGLGYLVGEMADRFEIPAMYGAILSIVLASAVFYFLTERIERWVRPF